MFLTKNLEGRIQCIDGDFVCINLHFNYNVDDKHSFIEQIYLNKSSGKWEPPIFSAKVRDLKFNNLSLMKEMQDIVDQTLDMFKKLDIS